MLVLVSGEQCVCVSIPTEGTLGADVGPPRQAGRGKELSLGSFPLPANDTDDDNEQIPPG